MPFQNFRSIAAIATTPISAQQLQRLTQIDSVTLWVPESVTGIDGVKVYQGSLKDQVATLWASHQALVFGLATGAVVRLIAPLLQDKFTDPAVVVVDEAGQFVISLCGGHQGGADQLTRLIALEMGATPVLTGAANRANLPGIDMLGVPFGWNRGEGDWTGVSAAIARQAAVQVIQEAGSALWQAHLPPTHPFQFGALELDASGQAVSEPQACVWISTVERRFVPDTSQPKVQWHPRVLWIGIGCERGSSKTLVEQAVQEALRASHLAEAAIAGIATIDLKADEVGLVEYCRERNLPLRCFTAEELRSVRVPTPSTIVEAEVGTPSVSEAAAILAAAAETDILGGSITASTVTSPSSSSLRVAKKVVRQPGEAGAVTVAVAEAEREYIGRTGQLWLVGMGPGQLDQITPAAQTAIAQADVLIGYSLYIDLIKPLLHPGQIVEAWPITQERQRAERAIELANWGLTVAVVSSGDCGIYGMAGLVLEQLRARGWDGKTPALQVFPGITALQAAASRVGAPLMHDFCAISLSDLLTPWEMITKRLTAAAQADFVVALYNPKSQTRTHQIEAAQQIFLQFRQADTPVALVRSAYREDEHITITTLGQMLDYPIDMLTTVLIGNQSSRTHTNWIITPRGYLGFDADNPSEPSQI